jgi:protein gp37
MSDRTRIAWADATWNPVIGCSKISPGCANCYAEKMACRLARMGQKYQHVVSGGAWNGTASYDDLSLPRWKKPRRVFVCSMGDLFHETVPRAVHSYLSGVFVDSPQHAFLVLTKRAKRMREFFSDCPPSPNVWVGVTAEDQERADERIPELLATPAEVRWVSVEPMLGPIDLENVHGVASWPVDVLSGGTWVLGKGTAIEGFCQHSNMTTLSWVVIGCESGPKRRPCNIEWARSLVGQCRTAGVAVFVKQLDINGRVSRDPAEWPEDLRVREWPR